jgi:hypothetical protein
LRHFNILAKNNSKLKIIKTMVTITSLWLPILVSAVVVFLLSSIIHMLLGYHNNDYKKVPNEDDVMDALRKFDIPPGEYSMPRAKSMKDMGTDEYKAKQNKGPVAMMTVLPNGEQSMSKNLILWFVYSVVVSVMAAYVAGRVLGPDAYYLEVFRFVGTTAFIAYAVGGWQNSIWWGQSWKTTALNTFDGLLYALFTAGVFGWLW